MQKVIQNRWDGGHAQDIRGFKTNEAEEVVNFDLFSNPHYLQPLRDSDTETVASGTLSDYRISDVVRIDSIGYVGLGRKSSASANPKFFKKTFLADTWTLSSEDSSGVTIDNSLVEYKGYAYALRTDASGHVLLEYTGSAINNRGTITDTGTPAKMFVHPEDNILYGVIGNTIFKWDGTTFTEVDSILPNNTTYYSLTDYGEYLAIAGYRNGKSLVYLWGRDTTLNTLQGVVDFGDGQLKVIENIDNILIGIMQLNIYTSSDSIVSPKLFLKGWSGGSVEVLKEITTSSSASLGITKAKVKGKLYFVCEFDNIHVAGKNEAGEWFISDSAYIANNTTAQTILGIAVINDIIFTCWSSGGTNYFYRTKSSSSFSNTSKYKTTINPNMPITDRYEFKQLKGVYVAFTGASSGTTIVKYLVDGGSATTLISESNSTGEKLYFTRAESDGKPLVSGREFQFQIESTGGAKIKELGYYYEVIKQVN